MESAGIEGIEDNNIFLKDEASRLKMLIVWELNSSYALLREKYPLTRFPGNAKIQSVFAQGPCNCE